MIITGKKFSKPEMSRVINGDIILSDQEEKPNLERLDKILVERYPGVNRSSLQKFVEEGRVTVNGKVIKKSNQKFEKTVDILVDFPSKEKTLPHLSVIFENEYVIVLDKPEGILSMKKGEYCAEPTLEDYGLIVHRLDRGTSGVIILAKDEKTQKYLRRQFQDRKTHKTYYAVVSGRPKLDEAVINLPIARNLRHKTTFQVDPSGKPAETYYTVVDSNDRHSLLKLKPKTGRTHQLRVHLKYIGTPILGDPVYNETKDNATRLFLHASSLEITIPTKSGNVRETFFSPVPKEFSEIMDKKNDGIN